MAREVQGPVAEVEAQPQEGLEAVRRILTQAPGGQLVLSTGDLEARQRQTSSPSQAPGASGKKAATSQHSRPSLATTYVAPRTQLEQALVQLWQQSLKVERVGISDSFFELGGHSILAIEPSWPRGPHLTIVRLVLARAWRHGYERAAGPLGDMALFYAWAGAVMLRRGTPLHEAVRAGARLARARGCGPGSGRDPARQEERHAGRRRRLQLLRQQEHDHGRGRHGAHERCGDRYAFVASFENA